MAPDGDGEEMLVWTGEILEVPGYTQISLQMVSVKMKEWAQWQGQYLHISKKGFIPAPVKEMKCQCLSVN